MRGSTESQGPTNKLKYQWFRRQRALAPYLFISPFCIAFFVFMAFPTVFGFYMSLTDWIGVRSHKFIGISHYMGLISLDNTFRLVLKNTLWYSAASLLIVVPLALFLAALLNSQHLKLREFFRVVYFTPIVNSAIVIGMMFTLLYDYEYGFINYLFRSVGLPSLRWLGDENLVKLAVIGQIIWRWTGYIMMYFLAGLQGIPRDFYEAAMVDGATERQLFWHITLPLLRPVLIFVIVIVTIGSLQVFEDPYILTAGGPGDASRSVVQYLYRVSFEYMNLGRGAAVGFILFSLIFILSAIQMKALGIFQESR